MGSGMLKDRLTREQTDALSDSQVKDLNETESMKAQSKDVLGSMEKEWSATDRLDAATIALEGGKGTAGTSNKEMAELEAEHKSAQQDYEAAVADRKEAKAGRPMSAVIIVLIVVGTLFVLAGSIFFIAKFVVPKTKPSKPAPPLGPKQVAVALETGDGGNNNKQLPGWNIGLQDV